MTEKKTRVVPQLSKDIRTLNSLRAKRAKVHELDEQIAEMEAKVAKELGLIDAEL